ncbi:hypothetical protein K0U00_26580, partial [Paenibacillus sepulcri]|nr:hypothetical protein [Paenibacillus sepulcri]
MTIHALTSEDNGKIAEIIESPDGIRFILRGVGLTTPYFAGMLSRMLICSYGKPWDAEPVLLNQP